MRKSRFTDSQIMAVLKQAESGAPVPELCREHGMGQCAGNRGQTTINPLHRFELSKFGYKARIVCRM